MVTTPERAIEQAGLTEPAGQVPLKVFGKPAGRTLACLGILVVFVLLRAPFVSVPLERDEGEYAYIAQRALHSEVPYRDAFDQKPPGIFLIYVLIFLALGQSIEAIHLGLHLWVLAVVVLVYRLVSRRAGPRAGLLAALALAVMSIDPNLLGGAANTEQFMLLPLVGSLLCLAPVAGRPGRWRIAAAGALGAAAFWIKQVAATNFVFLVLWLVFLYFGERPRRRPRELVLDLGGLLAGAAALTAPLLLYFAAAGAWSQFVYCVFTYNFIYSAAQTHSVSALAAEFWVSFGPILWSSWPFVVALALGVVHLARRRAGRDLALFGGLLVFSFAGVCVGGYFRCHYFIQVLPAAAALAGVGLAGLLDLAGRLRRPATRVALRAALIGVVLAVPVAANRDIFFAPGPDFISSMMYPGNPFVCSREIAERIKGDSSELDTVLILGSEPQILFYAHRKSATRYIIFYPLAATPYAGLLDQQQAALAEIQASRPKYVVSMERISSSLMMTPRSEHYLFRQIGEYCKQRKYTAQDFYLVLTPPWSEIEGATYKVLSPQEARGLEVRAGRPLLGAVLWLRPHGD